MTYSVVMKPALPAVVYFKPACCKLEPANNTNPVAMIKNIDFRSKTGVAFCVTSLGISAFAERFPLFNGLNRLKGNRISAPNKKSQSVEGVYVKVACRHTLHCKRASPDQRHQE